MVDGGQYGGDMMGSIDTGSSTQRYGINFSLNVKYKRIIINNVDCSNNQTGSHQFTVGNGTDNMIHNVIPFHGSHAGAH